MAAFQGIKLAEVGLSLKVLFLLATIAYCTAETCLDKEEVTTSCTPTGLKPTAATGQPMPGVVNVTDSVTATDEDLENPNVITSTEVLSSTVSLQTTSTISPSSTLMTTTTTAIIPYSTSQVTNFSSTVAPSLNRTNTTQSQTSLRITISVSQFTTRLVTEIQSTESHSSTSPTGPSTSSISVTASVSRSTRRVIDTRISSLVTLAVQPTSTVVVQLQNTGIATIVGGAVGAVIFTAAVIIFIIILIVLCICLRNKKQRKLAQEIYSSSDNPYISSEIYSSSDNPYTSSTYTTIEPAAYETPMPSLSHSSQTTGSSPSVPQLYEEPVQSIPQDFSASTGEYELVNVVNRNADEQYSTVGDSGYYTSSNGDSERHTHQKNGGKDERVYFTLDKGQDVRQANKVQTNGAHKTTNVPEDKDHLYFTIEKRDVVV